MRALQYQIQAIYFFIVRRTMEEMLTFRTFLSRRFIGELIMRSRRRCIDIMRQNTVCAGGDLQNLSYQRANQRQWRDSGERISAILLSVAIASR